MDRSTFSSKAEYWQRVLDEQRLSKLSVAAFCVQNSISIPSFYQWRKKLQPPQPSVASQSLLGGDHRAKDSERRIALGEDRSLAPAQEVGYRANSIGSTRDNTAGELSKSIAQLYTVEVTWAHCYRDSVRLSSRNTLHF
jgi:hypothetical protein